MTRLVPDYDFRVNDVSIKTDSVLEKLTVDLPVNSQASSFLARFENGDGSFSNYFNYHDDIKIYLGYESEGTVGVFHGRVEKVKKIFNKSGAVVEVSGRGNWVKLMEKFTVNSYENTDLGTIITTEVGALVSGITTNNVDSAGISPEEEFLDHVFLNQMVSDYCTKAQYFAWVDFDDDLHFTGNPGANSVSISSGSGGNVEAITMGIDWKSVRNYIRAYGAQVEGVQLFKTEQDDSSVAKYGTVMKIIKNAGMDNVSLVQSIADAALLETKEAEWGGMATVYGDERIEPGKTITVNVPEIGENASYRVQHVKHSFEPKGSGFLTTVMLVEDEQNTAQFYKELYEKNKDSIEFANEGNYDESYVYKFTSDQDSLWTFSGLDTTDSYLRIKATGLPSSSGTATITNSIVGDKNYTKCLPYANDQFPGNNGNIYQVSNDGGSTWETLDPFGGADDSPVEHSFSSSSGDKNNLKFKITMSKFDALFFGGAQNIVGCRPQDYVVWWKNGIPYLSSNIAGLALDYDDRRLYVIEDGTGKIYSCDPTTGKNDKEEVDLAIDISGGCYDGSNISVMDRNNNRISKRTAGDLATEAANYSLASQSGEGRGLGWDGSNYIYTSRPTGGSNDRASNAVYVTCNSTQRLPNDWYYGGSGTYAQTGAGYNSVNSKFYAVRDGTKYLMEFNSDMVSVSAALNMEIVCGASGYEPQSCCDDNVTLWSTNYNGSTNRIAKHTAGSYGTAAAATYDFSESSYGKFVGICFDGTDLWVLSDKGTYGTWYRLNTSGIIQATHTITSNNSTGNKWADCEWDGSNLYATYTTKGTTDRDKIIYKFNSTPTTISAEINIGFFPKKKLNDYDGTIGRGLAWDGSNFWITWYYDLAVTNGSWFRLANQNDFGAVTEAWYPYDCCSDGTYIWFIEDTHFTTKINRQTGEEIESIVRYDSENARGAEYGFTVDQSYIYTFGARLKLDW